MSLAPEINTLKVKQKKIVHNNEEVSMKKTEMSEEDLNLQDLSPDGSVSVALYGAGGLGKTAVLRFAVRNNPNSIPITTIDTSGLSDIYDGVKSIRIGNLVGSGKLRKDNVDHIRDFVSDYVENVSFADVNIVVHSLSGGSGSVIGPMMVDEILRQKKVAIVIAIVDQDSEVDTINSLNTLRSIDNIIKGRDGYLPTILFDNNNGRPAVDKGVDQTLIKLDLLLNTPLIGIDAKDRLRFLDPSSFDGVTKGIKLLNLSKQEDGEWEKNGQVIPTDKNSGIDSVMIISNQEDHLTLTRRCKVTFRGYYPKSGDTMIASTGYAIPDSLIKSLNSTIHGHKSSAVKKETKIEAEYEIGQTDGGLVL